LYPVLTLIMCGSLFFVLIWVQDKKLIDERSSILVQLALQVGMCLVKSH